MTCTNMKCFIVILSSWLDLEAYVKQVQGYMAGVLMFMENVHYENYAWSLAFFGPKIKHVF